MICGGATAKIDGSFSARICCNGLNPAKPDRFPMMRDLLHMKQTRSAIERSRADHWHCLSHVTAERALEEAHLLDALPSLEGLPLAGVPYVVKNSFDVEGIQTLAGGPGTQAPAVAQRDAELVRRLRAAGAVLVGAAHMDEYAHGFLGDNPHYGAVINPTDGFAYTGGSSSGCAAAVAAGIVPFAIGSDTNGSVRVPAAFCRILALKPTYGKLPLDGCVPLAQSLDHAGILASSLAMLERVWRALDPDATEKAPGMRGKKIRAGFAAGRYVQLSDERVRRSFQALRAAYRDMPDVEMPDIEASFAAAALMTGYEAAANHRQRMQDKPYMYSTALTKRLQAALQIDQVAYQQARRVSDVIRRSVLQQFEKHGVDVLVAPVTPVVRVAVGQREVVLDGEKLQIADVVGLFTRPFSLTGFPVMTVPIRPASAQSGSPAALQLVARPGEEEYLFAFAQEVG